MKGPAGKISQKKGVSRYRFRLLISGCCGVLHLKMAEPFFGFRIFFGERSVFVKESGQGVAVDPDFVVPLFLGFVKNKLQAPVKMHHVNIVRVFHRTVAGMPHVADHVSGGDNAAGFKMQRVREILPQMRVVIIAPAVKTADADAPAAILVPAKRFHIAGFDGDDGRTNQNEK